MLKVTTGKVSGGAVRAVIYGTEGIGKSTLAAQIPGAVFLDYEDGSAQVDCTRAVIKDWRAGEAAVASLIADPQGFKAVVIDTADWCEKALIETMLGRKGFKSIEDYGFGKGYKAVEEEFSRFLATLDGLIARGIHVVFLAHSTVKRVSPPDQTDGFDRYELKLTKQVSPLLKEWADMVLFINYKIQVVEGTDGKLKAQGGKERIIFTTHSPAWDAKNRFGLADELPMKFDNIARVFATGAVTNSAPTGTVSKPAAKADTAGNATTVAPPAVSAPTVITATPVTQKPVTAPAAPTPPVADHIPGLVDPVVEVPANITKWLDDNATAINGYLTRVQWLPAGKVWRDLIADKLTLIVSKPEKFARAAGVPAPAA